MVLKKADAVDVEEPSLPRCRRRPRRYETGDALLHFAATVEDHYRQIYSEVLDLADLASLFCPEVTRTTPQSTKSEKFFWGRTHRPPVFLFFLIFLLT